MDDRAAPPIRRDGDAADRNVVYSERAGIDYNGMIGAADAHDLKRKARDDRFLKATARANRRTTPSASGSTAMAPAADAAAPSSGWLCTKDL